MTLTFFSDVMLRVSKWRSKRCFAGEGREAIDSAIERCRIEGSCVSMSQSGSVNGTKRYLSEDEALGSPRNMYAPPVSPCIRMQSSCMNLPMSSPTMLAPLGSCVTVPYGEVAGVTTSRYRTSAPIRRISLNRLQRRTGLEPTDDD